MGKNKGSSFERKVCWDLSRLIDPKGEDTLFWRSAMSGGRSTIQKRKGIKNTTQLGDITAVHEKGLYLTELFVIECKFYKSLGIESSLLVQKGQLYKFWKLVKKVAKRNDRSPILIAKQNRSPVLIIFDKNGLQKWNTFGQEANPIIYARRTNMYMCLYNEVIKCHG